MADSTTLFERWLCRLGMHGWHFHSAASKQCRRCGLQRFLIGRPGADRWVNADELEERE